MRDRGVSKESEIMMRLSEQSLELVRVSTRVADPDQGCGSGSRLDPDSTGSVDPDPDPESGSRRAKMTHKSSKKY
jgi:hypothetical protein